MAVLDFGAGIGRLPLEIFKEHRFRSPGVVRWMCWDENPSRRAQLRSLSVSHGVPGEVPEDVAGIPLETADVCVMENVVHELALAAFAEAIALTSVSLKPDQGKLVILELFPLIHAEKYAVPYPPEELLELLESLGYLAASTRVAVHGVNAYIITASRRAALPAQPAIIEKIESTWERLKLRAIKSYMARERVASYLDYVFTLQDLCTIASVDAYHAGLWT